MNNWINDCLNNTFLNIHIGKLLFLRWNNWMRSLVFFWKHFNPSSNCSSFARSARRIPPVGNRCIPGKTLDCQWTKGVGKASPAQILEVISRDILFIILIKYKTRGAIKPVIREFIPAQELGSQLGQPRGMEHAYMTGPGISTKGKAQRWHGVP